MKERGIKYETKEYKQTGKGNYFINISYHYYNSILVGKVEDVNNIEDISKLDKNEFVNLLNSYKNEEGQYPTDWKKWKLGEDGYPTFE